MIEQYINASSWSKVGFYQSARDGRILSANNGLALILGFENAQHLTHSVRMQDLYYDPADREWLFREYEKSGGNLPESIEICWKHRNGDPVWVIHHALTTVDEDGTILYCEGSVIDVTDRKMAEWYNKIQHDLMIGLSATSDLDEALNLVMDTACLINNIDCGGVYLLNTAQTAIELKVHRGLSEHFIRSTLSIAIDSEQLRILHKGETIHRSIKDLNINNNSLYSSEGLKALLIVPIRFGNRTIASLNLASKTTEAIPDKVILVIETLAQCIGGTVRRIHSESDLLRSNRELQLLFDSSDDIMIIADGNFNILKINNKGLRTLGYSHNETVGMNILGLHPPNNKEEATSILNTIFEAGSGTCRIPLLHKEGHSLPVETIVMISKTGEQQIVIGRSRMI